MFLAGTNVLSLNNEKKYIAPHLKKIYNEHGPSKKSPRTIEERNLRRKSKCFVKQVKLGQFVAENTILSLKVNWRVCIEK